ncbi:MAG: hypothetical protein O2794_01320 [bacterium]|nr:hypothetical protein [bacterium]
MWPIDQTVRTALATARAFLLLLYLEEEACMIASRERFLEMGSLLAHATGVYQELCEGPLKVMVRDCRGRDPNLAQAFQGLNLFVVAVNRFIQVGNIIVDANDESQLDYLHPGTDLLIIDIHSFMIMAELLKTNSDGILAFAQHFGIFAESGVELTLREATQVLEMAIEMTTALGEIHTIMQGIFTFNEG